MTTVQLATDETQVTDGAPVILGNSSLRGMSGIKGLVQAGIVGNTTIKLQGRLNEDIAWLDLATFTEAGAQEVLLLPEIRYSVTATEEGASASLAVAFTPA
jgi:hypothetical protein